MSSESENIHTKKIKVFDLLVDETFDELLEEEDYDLRLEELARLSDSSNDDYQDELITKYVRARGKMLIRRALLVFALEQAELTDKENNA